MGLTKVRVGYLHFLLPKHLQSIHTTWNWYCYVLIIHFGKATVIVYVKNCLLSAFNLSKAFFMMF